jgi:ABC-type multidrug transport system fused ATPase/permease subunit
MNCDKIYVIHKGNVSESGSHSELVENPENIYHELFKKHSNQINIL